MQNIDLICVGKLNAKYFAEGVAEYQKRLAAFASFRIIELPEEKIEEKNASDAVVKKALFLCFAAINGAIPVTGLHDGRILFDQAEIQPVLCSISGCAHTTVACAHDDDIGIPCLGDGGLVDVGLGAQPV